MVHTPCLWCSGIQYADLLGFLLPCPGRQDSAGEGISRLNWQGNVTFAKAQFTGSSACKLITATLLYTLPQKITSFYLDSGVFNAKLIVQLHSDPGKKSITWVSSKHD